MKKLTKPQLIQALEKAERRPNDVASILGKVGLAGLGGAGGAAAASTLFATTVTTTVTAPVLGSLSLGGWLGATAAATAVVAAPATLILGGAATGVALSYGILRLLNNGASEDRKRAEYVVALRQKIDDYNKAKPESEAAAESLARLAGMYALLLKLNAIDIDGVTQLFDGINRGVIQLDFALNNARGWLDTLEATQHNAIGDASSR